MAAQHNKPAGACMPGVFRVVSGWPGPVVRSAAGWITAFPGKTDLDGRPLRTGACLSLKFVAGIGPSPPDHVRGRL